MAETKNEGEGSRSAAKQYNDSTKAFTQSGKVPKAAEDAKRAVESPEAADLKRAEAEGKRHSHGEDPQVKR
ncbi:hypothetical protein JYK14_04550 [Siccirubricoccus sp. KC 17139]|uniref:Uncharacterized protein n=1 Tax=Siccirubricoccus soli TaxID=2899147 RepID=A0ABT1D0K4_9PROT|nr:hypothetical protein [Siccirubricoccus soli]MCO6415448.1 hypothetical protein [Siccirubricoccus soli]MCP2681580.1 hypothetical protein [Siccirubricoccus soli]